MLVEARGSKDKGSKDEPLASRTASEAEVKLSDVLEPKTTRLYVN
jgi:hypothetical protein